eukprot:scpid84150/ scgid14232/ CAAX prenyl protease 2; Farnesylated proteins-converting enzyme 2; Prenyl protein-specific endoprotease 2; Protein severas
MGVLEQFIEPVGFADVSASVALLTCLGLSTLFVILLNAVSRKARDHPETMVRRMIVAVVVMPVVSIIVLTLLSSRDTTDKAMPLYEWLGFRTHRLWYAILCPIVLVTVGYGSEYLHRILNREPLLDVGDLLCLHGFRNIIAAPLAEEFVFRSCMLPLLLPHWSVTICVFLAPAIFGVAHLHLAWEAYRNGERIQRLILVACAQICYTTLFGAFSAFLFLRTGHFVACYLSHAYCNMLGLPNFGEIPAHPHKSVLMVGHVVAMVLFFGLLAPLTDVSLTGTQFSSYFVP